MSNFYFYYGAGDEGAMNVCDITWDGLGKVCSCTWVIVVLTDAAACYEQKVASKADDQQQVNAALGARQIYKNGPDIHTIKNILFPKRNENPKIPLI